MELLDDLGLTGVRVAYYRRSGPSDPASLRTSNRPARIPARRARIRPPRLVIGGATAGIEVDLATAVHQVFEGPSSPPTRGISCPRP